MGKEEILDQISEMLIDQLGLDESEIFPDAEFAADLGADSLDLVELIMSMEEEFDLNIPDEDVEDIVTVRDAVQYIEQHTE